MNYLEDDTFPLTDNTIKPYVTDLQSGSPERVIITV